nr:5-methyltetrahydropteroyltriglutamate--homocysteine S-methyltransferase [uncultured Cohaesibacter sp.]
MTIQTANLGFPRIGRNREWKFALDGFFAGTLTQPDIIAIARDLQIHNWKLQAEKGIDIIPSNDFSFYDHVLDVSAMVGAIPEGYGWSEGPIFLDTYFALARGMRAHKSQDGTIRAYKPALEMSKWFDTNYHYIVPEFASDQIFSLTENKPLKAFKLAQVNGLHTRPVVLGPVTFLKLGKVRDGAIAPLDLLDKLLPVYVQILSELSLAGADWVQIDEPCLSQDLSEFEQQCFLRAYGAFNEAVPALSIIVANYFGPFGDNLKTALSLPVAGLHADCVRGDFELDTLLQEVPDSLTLSLGVIDGRNIWRADLDRLDALLEPLRKREQLLSPLTKRTGHNIQLAPSCSLIHVPVDIASEDELEPGLRMGLAFATQKLEELSNLAQVVGGKRSEVEPKLRASLQALMARRNLPGCYDRSVRGRQNRISSDMYWRKSRYPERRRVQQIKLGLPLFPTTTIGSFPQTAEIRKARSDRKKGLIDDASYKKFLREETKRAIFWQDSIGLDVLVHGEFERNDMVQYFAEKLNGFAFTKKGWVQSYGSRCVRPPILYGDVSRSAPMTVDWWRYAQSLTQKPVKGMLTGPVTILNWSFVRDDLPRADVCSQIALAIRDEVEDLETAGARIIQIDEAALREGLPLRKEDWRSYLAWAIEAFRLASSGVDDTTQIHTHMCYSEFNDIIEEIIAMDADVISIESSRSKMELMDGFSNRKYPNEIGPGVYDIHSPLIPSKEEIEKLLSLALERLDGHQLWVNPDCGLKTRNWHEVRPALVNMVEAAIRLRSQTAVAAQ